MWEIKDYNMTCHRESVGNLNSRGHPLGYLLSMVGLKGQQDKIFKHCNVF
jgi:hypothetical protein